MKFPSGRRFLAGERAAGRGWQRGEGAGGVSAGVAPDPGTGPGGRRLGSTRGSGPARAGLGSDPWEGAASKGQPHAGCGGMGAGTVTGREALDSGLISSRTPHNTASWEPVKTLVSQGAATGHPERLGTRMSANGPRSLRSLVHPAILLPGLLTHKSFQPRNFQEEPQTAKQKRFFDSAELGW